ncbi:DUF4232 domain-containing protein [Virgisporangium aurantiacum]|nr:DUF4232 domain-containing protein [Virgisporangium aurantiacum]
MRVTALAVAAALTLMVATGCTDKPRHQDGTAAPAGSPSASTEGTPPTESAPTEASTTPTGTPTNVGANTPAKCQTNQLTGDIEQYAPPGQAGSSYQARVKLTNTGNRCTLAGYITLQLLANNEPRETKVTRSDGAVETVTLNRGDSAWALIVWTFRPNADEADTQPLCGPRATAALVTPPGASGSIRIAEEFGVVCAHGEIVTRPVSATRPS